MNRAADQFKNFLEDFLTQNALEVLNKTKKRTPVDTGELRRNWEISSVVRKGADLVVYLYNSKEYASYVEEGHATRNREGWGRRLLHGYNFNRRNWKKNASEI